MRSALAWSILFGSAAAAANVAGGLAVVARRHWNEMFLKYFLGLGAGLHARGHVPAHAARSR